MSDIMEKRLFHRLLIDTTIEQQNITDDSVSHGKAKDISCGGICITTEDEPLAHGNRYLLRFILPGEPAPLEIEGRVVWSRSYATETTTLYDNGIVFIDIKDDYLRMIEEYSIGAVMEKD